MSLKDGLKAWAARTVGLYHNLAMTEKDCNLAFYTQTNLTEVEKYPELLVLAINPGSGGPYFSESGKTMGRLIIRFGKSGELGMATWMETLY